MHLAQTIIFPFTQDLSRFRTLSLDIENLIFSYLGVDIATLLMDNKSPDDYFFPAFLPGDHGGCGGC